jgi:signal transduction histidine kinase
VFGAIKYGTIAASKCLFRTFWSGFGRQRRGLSRMRHCACGAKVWGVESPFVFLARRRILGVGLALVAEICLVAVLTLAPAPVEAGIPGVVAAAIAGTVAVVFGAVDGILVALIGALLFATLEGWSVGAFAALIVWPSVVGAVGLFAHRVEQRRDLFRQIVSEQDGERRRLALDLHDQKAQVLAGALMMLRSADPPLGSWC